MKKAARSLSARMLHLCLVTLLLTAFLPIRAASNSLQPGASFSSSGSTYPQIAIGPLLVVGFMGGHIKADNMVHQEAQIAQDLQRRNLGAVKALTFANHDGGLALQAVVHFLDTDADGRVSDEEKRNARVVIYGHSWGASETVTLARTLGRMGVPVLLTIQVDSVQKMGENDRMIPSNVHQAINFYQAEGLLNGRSLILADDPHRTTILGNQKLSYKNAPVNCDRFPWFARTFMKTHIEIENDPAVWNLVEAMIQERVNFDQAEAANDIATP